jgi:hypothetical protein
MTIQNIGEATTRELPVVRMHRDHHRGRRPRTIIVADIKTAPVLSRHDRILAPPGADISIVPVLAHHDHDRVRAPPGAENMQIARATANTGDTHVAAHDHDHLMPQVVSEVPHASTCHQPGRTILRLGHPYLIPRLPVAFISALPPRQLPPLSPPSHTCPRGRRPR